MAKIEFRGVVYDAQETETVLDALLRQGAGAGYSCKKGVCQTCLIRCTSSAPPTTAQDGLKPTLRERGYFLPCVCPATTDMVLLDPRDADVLGHAIVVDKVRLAGDVCLLRLEPSTSLYYHAGQFVNLRRPDGLMRSYSLASVPHKDAHLELHVRRMKNGKMSNWIWDELEPGQPIDFYGPTGSCFYLPGREDDDLLLIGAGTGLAPLVGIARDALLSGHRGVVRLYHGSTTVAGLYLHQDLLELARRFSNFRYTPCLDGAEDAPGCARGRANDVAFSENERLPRVRVYLCGPPDMVSASKKRAYLAGAALADILADPFELADLRRKPR